MRSVLIILSVALSIALANVERKSNFTKPVINLERRRPPVWNRPPEERRKLSIFPKTNLKFVVTPKTIQNDKSAKEGITTKRPIMRKFVMQDNNEKGTWAFAPREPLMKSKRFTVTLAPPKLNKGFDEPKPEESRKVNTVVSNTKKVQDLSKVRNLNKGNLIEVMHHKTINNSVSNKTEQVEPKLVEVTTGVLEANYTNIDIIEVNYKMAVKNAEDYVIDVRRLNDEEMPVIANETKTDYNAFQPETNIEVSEFENKNEDSKNSEVRTFDLSEIKYPINDNVNNSLIINNESNIHKIGQMLAFNDLEILLEKIINNTGELSQNLPSDPNVSDSTSVFNSQTNDTLEDISQFEVSKPNSFYEVISVGNDGDQNIKQASSVEGPIVQDSLNMDKITTTLSDTNDLNDVNHLKENNGQSLFLGNLAALLNFMEEEKNKEIMVHQETIDDDINKSKTDNVNASITTFNASESGAAAETSGLFMTNKAKYELETEVLRKSDDNNSTNLNSAEILLEVYESDRDLSSEERTAESFSVEDNKDVSKESVTESLNFAVEDISNETRETSEESISDTLYNNNTEELSNEPLIDVSNQLTSGAISDESSSNIAAEELSNEFDISNNLTDEISSESIIEATNNITDEERNDVSSSNMSGEVLSNESVLDKSINLTEEVSDEFIAENLNNLTSEEISNESTLNVADEELSNDSYVDKSTNLTEEVSDEFIVENSNNLTSEEISNESTSTVPGEELSNESYVDKSTNLTEEVSDEFVVENSNNLTSEEISNESTLNVAGKELSNESPADKSTNLTEEVSNESGIGTSDDFTNDNLSDEWLENQSVGVNEELIAEESVGSSQDPSEEAMSLEALTNRFKRSNNIIEEENVATTVSGFKYTGHVKSLSHDLSYKNINA